MAISENDVEFFAAMSGIFPGKNLLWIRMYFG